MEKYKHECDATEFQGDEGSITGGSLNEANIARRSFLRRIASWSAASAVFGLGAETWMQTVSKRSAISSAMAMGAARNAQLHPFPADDPYNMAIGSNAYYAPIGDPATEDVRNYNGAVSAGAWSHPIYFTSRADPLIECYDRRTTNPNIQSYREDEDGLTCCLYEHFPLDVVPAVGTGWPDGRGDHSLQIIRDNELVSFFVFDWENEDPTTQRAGGFRIARNRLDHYSFSSHPNRLPGPEQNPLANRSGTRVTSCPDIAGLIRKHEVDPADPNYTGTVHIPHAIGVGMHLNDQLGRPNNEELGGDPRSPLYRERVMFPARTGFYTRDDRNGGAGGNVKIGMKFALDPTIVTDSYLDGISDPHARAILRALRDYGMYVNEGASSRNVLYAEIGLPQSVISALQTWDEPGPDGVSPVKHLRRVAATASDGSVIHRPVESDWQSWADNGEGWGGGAPRVPYSPPLSPDVRPQSPGSINVTESRRFGDTA